jgi:hypothetical protein
MGLRTGISCNEDVKAFLLVQDNRLIHPITPWKAACLEEPAPQDFLRLVKSGEPFIAARQPSPVENLAQAVARDEGKLKKKNQNAYVPERDSRIEQAQTRTDEANTRTDEANVRTDQANTRTEEANTRTEEANTRTE